MIVRVVRPAWGRGGVYLDKGRARPVTAGLSTRLRSYLQLKHPLCANELITFPVPGTESKRPRFLLGAL